MANHLPSSNFVVSDDEELKPEGEAHLGMTSDFIVPARGSLRLTSAGKRRDRPSFVLSSSESDMSDEVDDMSMTEIDEECHHITDRDR